jgi:uncharacterized protein YggE
MSHPTLFIVGTAEREVMPDRFVINVSITSLLYETPQRALAECADARARVRDDLFAVLPDLTIRDATITTPRDASESVPQPGACGQAPSASGSKTEYRYESLGYRGYCTVTIHADAARAAAVLAQAGMHPDAYQTRHTFEISRERERSTKHELEVAAIHDALARASDLAAAAGHTVTGVVSIGEIAPPRDREFADDDDVAYSPMMEHASAVERVEEALSELRSEPRLLSATMPVRVAIRPASEDADA